MASIRFLTVARHFPGLVAQAVRLGFRAGKRDTVATILLNMTSGIFTGYALFATTGMLQALFAAGPTPARVRAAIPSLVLVTAALDARAEYALFETVRRHAENRTVLIITHRLASVRHADRIYVLHEGQEIEQGTHADLMALAGRYAELYTLQASQYEAVTGPPSVPRQRSSEDDVLA